MNALDLGKLRAELRRDEGDVRHPYTDRTGHLTIGVGHNLSARPLSDAVVEQLLTEDVTIAIEALDRALPWWRDLGDVRGRVFVNMVFNLGIGTFLTLTSLLVHAQAKEFAAAADRMLHFRWASQVGDRAVRLATMMRTGHDPA